MLGPALCGLAEKPVPFGGAVIGLEGREGEGSNVIPLEGTPAEPPCPLQLNPGGNDATTRHSAALSRPSQTTYPIRARAAPSALAKFPLSTINWPRLRAAGAGMIQLSLGG